MPSTVSPEAQKWLASLLEKKSQPQTLGGKACRHGCLAKKGLSRGSPAIPRNIEETSIAGVRTDVINSSGGAGG